MLNKCKKIGVLLVIIAMSTVLLFSCSNKENNNYDNLVPPDMNISSGEYNINFIEMHNSVLDALMEQYTPFFFIKEGEFDISGDNEKKLIRIECTCLDGTTVMDVDLFFSLVLNYISINASEQDFRFTQPKKDNTNTYIDFGNVFDTFDLELSAKTESGEVLRDDHISAGHTNPIDPRYWSE